MERSDLNYVEFFFKKHKVNHVTKKNFFFLINGQRNIIGCLQFFTTQLNHLIDYGFHIWNGNSFAFMIDVIVMNHNQLHNFDFHGRVCFIIVHPLTIILFQ